MMANENVKIEGVREIIDNLAKSQEQVKKAQREAVKAGAQIAAEELKRNVPVSDVGGDKLKHSVRVSGARRNTSSFEYYAAAGFPKGIAHRAHFPEFGTIKDPPQFYLAKTVRNSWGDIQKEMMNAVRRAIG